MKTERGERETHGLDLTLAKKESWGCTAEWELLRTRRWEMWLCCKRNTRPEVRNQGRLAVVGCCDSPELMTHGHGGTGVVL